MNDRGNDIYHAAAGTCEWLLRHQTYRDWVSHRRGLLWIKGKPGSGKSTLLKYALQHAHGGHETEDKALILSFFFHGRGSELQRTPLGLFRSLLHQLLSQVPGALSNLIDTFEDRRRKLGTPGEKWRWHPQELPGFFESSLPKVLDTYSVRLYIDALDESGKKNAIELLKKFKSLLQKLSSTNSQFGICVTCRHYPILVWDYGLEICLERENKRDISTYVRTELSSRHSRAIDLITDRALGVFLWAYLTVDRVLELEREGEGPIKILAEIQHIPQGLDELYDELIQNMKGIPASLRLMQWICFATRPLSIDELRWAMVVDADCPYKTLQQCRSGEDYTYDNDMMERRVKALSCGLAETVASSNARVVQFIHQSVKDFFVEKGLLATDGASQSANSAIARAHYRLFKSCIRYLEMEEIFQSITVHQRNLRSKVPLLHYATTTWVTHAKQSEAREVSQANLSDYLDWPSESLIQSWVRIYREIDMYSADCPPEGTNSLHVVSRYGLIQTLWVILQKADQLGNDIDCRDDYGRSPLSWAAEKGHEAIVKLLLATGKVDVNLKAYGGQTPLSWAAEKGHEAIVKLLLATGKVDVDLQAYGGQTPLSWAAEKGHQAIVKLLLATRRVSINSKAYGGQTPLSWAAEKGHAATVELLLATGKADVDSKDRYGRSPLSWAAEKGHEDVIKLLLATGKVDVDSKDQYGRSPIWWAVKKGHKTIIELLQV
ncbi:hypothetical protein FNYG_14580 [Fusarium nygamai]|uniref:Uncharacterized protein n=1 Tax=Gibberella nygamai TaxID=42673 RepID=A0A2K0USF2_GIBNY|nr:hypothetical protein FNYG_14580 [Fusarium nygamai]